MRFFRNPEIHRMTIIYLLLTAAGVVGIGSYVMWLSQNRAKTLFCGGAVLVLCLLFSLCYYIPTYLRYRRIIQLSQELDEMLHSNRPIPFSDYEEGELSILQSELSKLTTRLVEQAEALRADKQYLSEAMADISHQLRSPLTASQLILSLLREPDISESRRRELLQEQSNILSHMGWLVEVLLKMAKMDADMAYLKSEPVSVSRLLDKALEPLLIPMELRNQSLHREKITEDMEFTGDFSWSCEAILNVVKNCAEHIPQGGNIWISGRQTPLFLELTIEDDGSGFCEEDIPHLFERFYKGQNATGQSVGIGLALTRMIVAAQNGTIKAENRREGGARFLIRFYPNPSGIQK